MIHVIFVVLKSFLSMVPTFVWIGGIGIVVVWGVVMQQLWYAPKVIAK